MGHLSIFESNCTCPPVYHTKWRLHILSLSIAERRGLARPGIELESIVSVADFDH